MKPPHEVGRLAAGGAALVSVAGFLPDLRAGLARHGVAITLGDEVPFTEFFVGITRDELLALVPAAAKLLSEPAELLSEPAELPGEPAGPPAAAVAVEGLPAGLDAVVLDPAGVRLLAQIDDTRLRPLWTCWWQAISARRLADRAVAPPAEPAPDLTQSVRGFVVQARAAVANGWVVVLAGTPA